MPDPDKQQSHTTTTPRRVLWVASIAFSVAALLGSSALVELADRQPFGPGRDVLLSSAEKIDRAANFLSLNRPFDSARERLGREPVDPVDIDVLVARHRPHDGDRAPATGPDLRTVTADDPLRVAMAGDSMLSDVGFGLRLVIGGAPVEIDVDGRVNTGLSRAEEFDWPSRLARFSATDPPDADGVRPDVVVVMVGSNDFQTIRLEDQYARKGTPLWRSEYRRRVAGVMDLLEASNATVVWVGLPVVDHENLETGLPIMNQIYQEEAAARSWVTFVPMFDLFTDADGRYSADLTVGGELVEMRREDGVHWTKEGSERAGSRLRDVIVEQWRLDQPPG